MCYNLVTSSYFQCTPVQKELVNSLRNEVEILLGTASEIHILQIANN